MNHILVILLLWIPCAAAFFAFTTPVRAVTLAYLFGWLLLPWGQIEVEGFWNLDKILATNAGVVLGAAVFCRSHFAGYRLNWSDLALAVFLVGNFVTSVTNGLGAYDGVSSMTNKLIYFGIPFIMGRALIRTRADLHTACRLVVAGAALYVPLAVWEWRMSPQIHNSLYGFFQHSFRQHARWGFYRPVVCFPHALGLGVFFAWTTLAAWALLHYGHRRAGLGIPLRWALVLGGLGVAVSMSMGPWALCALAVAMYWYWRKTGRRWIMLAPALVATLWMGARSSGVTDGQWLSRWAAKISAERAESLGYRIHAEELLLQRAKQQVVWGWGGYGRNRVYTAEGRQAVAADGLWVILLGSYGVVGLVSFYLWWCSPLWLARRGAPPGYQDPVLVAVLAGLSVQAANFLFNGFLSPILTLLCGSAVTLLAGGRERAPVVQQADHAWGVTASSAGW